MTKLGGCGVTPSDFNEGQPYYYITTTYFLDFT